MCNVWERSALARKDEALMIDFVLFPVACFYKITKAASRQEDRGIPERPRREDMPRKPLYGELPE